MVQSREPSVLLTGQVLDADSSMPIELAAVSFMLEVASGSSVDFVREDYSYFDMWCDEDGRFAQELPLAFSHLSVSGVTVFAWGLDYDPFLRFFPVDELLNARPLEIVLPRGPLHIYEVSVLHAKTREPLPGIPIVIDLLAFRKSAGRLRGEPPVEPSDEPAEHRGTLRIETETDSDGRVDIAVPARSSFQANAGGTGVFVPDGGACQWVEHGDGWALLLDPAGILELEVRDARGRPEPTALVEILQPSGAIYPARLDENGKLKGIGLKGTYELSARLPRAGRDHRIVNTHDIPVVKAKLTIGEGETRSLVLELPDESAHLVCHVRHEDGSCAEGAILRVAKDDRRRCVREAHTGPDGLADLGFLVPGRYRLGEGYLDERELDLVEGENQVDLVLPKRFGLSGRVLDAKGAPLPDVQVHASDGDLTREVRTNADGRFSLPPLKAERLELSLFKYGFRHVRFSRENDGSEVTLTLGEAARFCVRCLVTKRPPTKRTEEIDARLTAVGLPPHCGLHLRRGMIGCNDTDFTLEFETLGFEFDERSTHIDLDGVEKRLILRVGPTVPIVREIPAGPNPVLSGIVLEAGYAIHGRVDDAGRHLANGGEGLVSVENGWLPRRFLYARIRDDGTFELEGLPGERMRLTVETRPPITADEHYEIFGASIEIDPRELRGGAVGTLALAPMPRAPW